MPEVAEATLTAQILLKYLKNKKLKYIKIKSGRYLNKEPVGFKEFKDQLPLTLVNVNSKGKFLYFDLINDLAPEQGSGAISSNNLSQSDRLSRRLRRDAQHPCSSPHIADDLVPVQGSGTISSDNLSLCDRLSRRLRRDAVHPCSSPHIADDN